MWHRFGVRFQLGFEIGLEPSKNVIDASRVRVRVRARLKVRVRVKVRVRLKVRVRFKVSGHE